jgi:branched-chain amino acid transport system substrate-binding protein
VDRALAFAKDDRFPSAREMREALAAACTAAFGAVPPLPRAAKAEYSAVVQTSATSDADTLEAPPVAKAPVSGGKAPTPRGPTPTPPASSACAPAPPASGSWPPPEEPGTVQVERPSGPARSSGAPVAESRPAPRRGRPWAIPAAAAVLAVGAVAAWRITRPSTGPGPADTSTTAAAPQRCALNKDCSAPEQVCGRAGVCVPRRGCAANAECMQQLGGKPAICRRDDGACVPLETAECKTLLKEKGDLENDGTIWIGAMVPQSGPNADDGGFVKVIDLARRDFLSIANGVPGARPTDPPRPLAVLLCDDSGDAAVPAHHLVDDVGVPAIIGFNRSKDVMDLAASLFNPKHVLAVASLNQSPMLTGIPHTPEGPRMVWRSTSSSLVTAAAVATFIEAELAPKLKLDDDEPARIVVVRRDNANQLALADKVVSLLRVRGKTVVQGGATVRQFTIDNEADKPDFTPIRREIVGLAPHVLLDMLGPLGFGADLYQAVERDWPAARARPYYISSSGSLILNSPQLKEMLVRRPDARGRVLAPDTPARVPANVKLSIHYNEVYGTKITPETTYGSPYDAFYVVAYGIAALGDKPVTGLELARAVPRLVPPGEPVEIGPAAIFGALKVLRDGKNIDLAGTTTSLDFDLETGDAPVDMVVMCLKKTAKGDLVAAESGLVYSAKTGQITGKSDCR